MTSESIVEIQLLLHWHGWFVPVNFLPHWPHVFPLVGGGVAGGEGR